ncbi:MMPL family transporter [Nakamurella leprariae]|uniref:MMPL family transporter n=1 Tax=Nakamurella leprariae TaxID=2803911 RepID=A0A938Y8C7_9ACTN|nr:MMPL family transporter [Nakamurella leprariae]MBM9467896.1 MMPL family transporter [Nakamurella leprariae]
MSTLLYRLAHGATRLRWAVLVVWLVLLGGMGGAALVFSGTLTSSFSIPGTAGQEALNTLQSEIPGAGATTGRIVFAAPQGSTLADPEYQQAIAETLQEIAPLDGVTGVVDPQTAQTIAPTGTVGYATVQFAGQLTEIPEATQDEIATVVAEHRVDGLEIELSGGAVKQTPAIGSTEALGVVVAMVVLLITFGSLVAAAMPMITALIGVAVGMAGILWVSGAVEMSNTAPILALMLGLAVGIDYALFIVSRHRSQLMDGMPVRESIARAVATAGTAVVFAGTTVLIALAGLSVVGIPFLTVMGLAAAGTVAVAVVIAITLLPALLAFAGERVVRKKDRARVAAVRAELAAGGGHHGVVDHAERSNRWIRFVSRRPALVLIVGVLGLGVLAVPFGSLHLGLPSDGVAGTDTTQRKAYDLISREFGPGFNNPLLITAEFDSPQPQLQQELAELGQGIQADFPGSIAFVAPGGANADGTFAFLTVIPTTGQTDEATDELVNDLRADAGNLGERIGATIAVTGFTAVAIDVSSKLADALPIYLIIVVGLALILLLLIFRSIVVPLKAVIGFLLTIGVSFGAVVAVYQWGWLGGIFGVDTPAPIISFLPILLIGVLFGLAMDYEVFLVAGMREAYVHGSPAERAVVGGFSAASRVVTAAAIIMTSVFAGFILAPDTIIASIGFALGLGVLVDAFVVRMTLVPAAMTLLGDKAWYLPKWLGRILPRVDIEGEQLLKQLAAREQGASGSPDERTDAVPAAVGAHSRADDGADGSANGHVDRLAHVGSHAAPEHAAPDNGSGTASGNGADGISDVAQVRTGGRHRAPED